MDKGIFSIAASFVEEFNDRVGQLSRLTNHPSSKVRFIELLLINLLKKYLPLIPQHYSLTLFISA